MVEWSNRNKITSSVIGSSIIGAIAAPGAVFAAERVLPRQMNFLKRIVADNIIMPHLDVYEKVFSRFLSATEKSKAQAADNNVEADPALQGEAPNSPRGRALAIADGMVAALMSWGMDFGATLGTMHMLNKKLGINTAPLRTTFADSAAALGVMAVMPTLLAKPSEALNQKLSSIIQKVTGMPKHHAEDFTVPVVYAGIPDLLGTAAALYSAHSFNKGRR